MVIWSEDFGGGFPAGWSTYTANTGAGNNGATSVGNTAECPWKHSMNGSWGYWNSVGTNSAGNPTGPADPINSSTASNGFLISDPDSANHWNGNPGSSSGSTYHYLESYFTTSSIDLTGWNNVSLENKSKEKEFPSLNDNDFYFVHSYHMKCKDKNEVLASTIYGKKIVSAVIKDNLLGVQFHPEKSQEKGKKFLKEFLDWKPE